MTTLKDIAKEAGISTVTVSNVINGNFNRVSAETVKRVNEIIDKYEYQPNAIARSLVKKESKIIGVVITHVDEQHFFLESPYNAWILSILEHVIRTNGYYLMVRSVTRGAESVSVFQDWNVDGVIFLGVFSEEVDKIRENAKLPMVFMDTYFDGKECANVGSMDYKGGYLAAKYLITSGHTKIAFCGPDTSKKGVVKERFRGFKDAMEENGLYISPDRIFVADTEYSCGLEIGKKIAFSSNKITAVVCMSDILAFGVIEGLRVSGQNVPDDVSVVGYDNLPECEYSSPKLTTVDQNVKMKAEKTADYLFWMIKEKENLIVDEKTDVKIIERHSVRRL